MWMGMRKGMRKGMRIWMMNRVAESGTFFAYSNDGVLNGRINWLAGVWIIVFGWDKDHVGGIYHGACKEYPKSH